MSEPKPMPTYWSLAEEVTHLHGQLDQLTAENAKLRRMLDERGTCRMVVDNKHRVDRVTTSWGCVCSACGGFHEFTHGEGWAYCPSCGRKVVDG